MNHWGWGSGVHTNRLAPGRRLLASHFFFLRLDFGFGLQKGVNVHRHGIVPLSL